MVLHADYPHQPGTLYDCPACETHCYCGDAYTPGVEYFDHNTPCIACANRNGTCCKVDADRCRRELP